MIVYATEDGVVLKKAELLFAGESPRGLIRMIRDIFSKVPRGYRGMIGSIFLQS
jgi:hypothetical protein